MAHAGAVKAFIGLGNPGEKFARTYHNAGFLLLDFLAEEPWTTLEAARARSVPLPLTGWKEKRDLGFAYQKRHGVLLVKPLGYMNESGRGVSAALHYFKILPGEFVLAHDDADLALGSAKLVHGGRAAGHHGVESVIKTLGTNGFWRLKIGIRPPEAAPAKKRKKAEEFVLSPVSRADHKKLERLFQRLSVTVMVNENPPSGARTIKESGNSAVAI